MRTRSDALLWHRKQARLEKDVGLKSWRRCRPRRCETFSCFFLLPWDLRKRGTGGQCSLFACSLVGRCWDGCWKKRPFWNVLFKVGGVLLCVLYATSQPLAPVALQGDRCTEDLIRATRPGK